jgi:hypothetical protein
MPGAYAHITLVNISKEPDELEKLDGFPTQAISSVMKYLKYCELGCVSPDYPYLAVGDSDAAKWADLMHYENTSTMIYKGIEFVRDELKGVKQKKAFSWLLGYVAHVVTDVTIHPVVQLKVGDYAQNKTAHRRCEMNQDSYIFQRMNLGGVGVSEHLDSGIKKCSDSSDSKKIDPVILSVWQYMLSNTHSDEYTANPPDINKWHEKFGYIVDNYAEEGNHLFPIARHVAVEAGLTYPNQDEIDMQYIKNLDSPQGKKSYDEIFDHAISNVRKYWNTVAQAVFSADEEYIALIEDWDLDTGKDNNNTYAMWRV